MYRSSFGPRDFDCTGDPACWPWIISPAAIAPASFGPALKSPGPKPLPPGCERCAVAARRLGVSRNSLQHRAKAAGRDGEGGLRPREWDALAKGLVRAACRQSLATGPKAVEMSQSCTAQHGSGHRRSRAA